MGNSRGTLVGAKLDGVNKKSIPAVAERHTAAVIGAFKLKCFVLAELSLFGRLRIRGHSSLQKPLRQRGNESLLLLLLVSLFLSLQRLVITVAVVALFAIAFSLQSAVITALRSLLTYYSLSFNHSIYYELFPPTQSEPIYTISE